MPQSNQRKVDRDQARASRNKPSVIARRRSNRIAYLIISLVIIIVCILVGIGYYQQYVVPFQQTVITFDDTVIKMRYFIDRARTSGASGMSTLQAITNELCIREGANRYGIEIKPEDVDQALRLRAAGSENVTITDAEFREWYRQQLNDQKISNKRYREIITTTLYEARLREYLYKGISNVLEHAHVYIIYANTYDEALAAKERVESGENFMNVARELSLKAVGEESDGEWGWVPKGAKVLNQDPFLWEAGTVSQVLAYLDESSMSSSSDMQISFYYILYTSEVKEQEIQPAYLSEVQNTFFQDWLNEEMKQHDIRYNYNSEIDKWINWQLVKSKTTST